MRKIKHIIFITQENRSFDSYFGTYPGADGIPMRNGAPIVSVPNPRTGTCVAPYHDADLIDTGGPHPAVSFRLDRDRGRIDGFIQQALDGTVS